MKKMLSTLLALAMALSLAGCGGSNQPAGSGTPGASSTPAAPGSSAQGGALDGVDPITLSIGHTGAEDSWNQSMCLAVKDKLDELSGGKITVNVYPNGTLGSDSEMVISVINGDLSMQCTNTSSVVNTVPDCGVADIPFLFNSVEDVRAALSDETFNRMLGESFNAADLNLLMIADQGFRCITSSKNITSFEDLSGLQIRVMDNANHIAFFTDATLAPTPLSFSELYLALQQGLLQAQENPYRTTVASKFYEVQKYLTNSNHVPQCNVIFMGKSTFDSLPAPYQEIVSKAFDELLPTAQELADDSMAADLDFLIEKGMTFVDFDQIDGLRQKLKEACVENAVERTSKTVSPALVDAYLAAAGYTK